MEATIRGEGVRLPWRHVPSAFVAAVEAVLGSGIVAASDCRGGFSPGPAAVLTMDDGRRVFVKACDEELSDVAVRMHRREALIVASLPPEVPVPALTATIEEDGWFGLLYDAVDGCTPSLPWRDDELEMVFGAMAELATIEPQPSPVLRSGREDLSRIFGFWTHVASTTGPDGLDDWSTRHLDVLVRAEEHAAEATAGTSLLHSDLRADNLLLHDGRVTMVDWSLATIGAPFVDRVLFAFACNLQGGPEPEEQIASLPADPDAVTAIVVGATGYLTIRSLEPPPPGLPTIRHFQAEQAVIGRRWCAQRLGLPLP